MARALALGVLAITCLITHSMAQRERCLKAEDCPSGKYCDVLGTCLPCGDCFLYNDPIGGGNCPERCHQPSTTCFISGQCPTGMYCTPLNTCSSCSTNCDSGQATIEQLRCDAVCSEPDPPNGYYLCSSHDDCIDSSYCDQNNNCYNCKDCFNYHDPYDGSGQCPDKCRDESLPCQADYHCRRDEFCTSDSTCMACAQCSEDLLPLGKDCQAVCAGSPSTTAAADSSQGSSTPISTPVPKPTFDTTVRISSTAVTSDTSTALPHSSRTDRASTSPSSTSTATTTTTTTTTTTSATGFQTQATRPPAPTTTTTTSTTSTTTTTSTTSTTTTTTTTSTTTTTTTTSTTTTTTTSHLLCCPYTHVSSETGAVWTPADCGLHEHACPGDDPGTIKRWCAATGWADTEDTSDCLHTVVSNLVQELEDTDQVPLNTALEFLQRSHELVERTPALGDALLQTIILGASRVASSAVGLTNNEHRDFLATLDTAITAFSTSPLRVSDRDNITATLRDTMLTAFDTACADALANFPNDTVVGTTVLFSHRTQNFVLECHVLELNRGGDVLWQPQFPDAVPFVRMSASTLSALRRYVDSHEVAATTSNTGHPRVLASQTSSAGITSVLLQLNTLPAFAFSREAANVSDAVVQASVPGLASSQFEADAGVVFKVSEEVAVRPSHSACAQWVDGEWSTHGCTTTIDIDNTILCQCDSFTAYGLLPSSEISQLAPIALSADDGLQPGLWPFVFLILAVVENVVVLGTFLFASAFAHAPRKFTAVQVTLALLAISVSLLVGLSKPLHDGCSFFAPALLMAFFSLFVWLLLSLRYLYIVGGLRYDTTAPRAIPMLLWGWGVGLILLAILLAAQFAGSGLLDKSIGDHVCWAEGSVVLGVAYVPTTLVIASCLGCMVAMWFLDGTLYDPARNLTSHKPSIWPSFVFFFLCTFAWVSMLWAFEARSEDGLIMLTFVWLVACSYFTVLQLVCAKNDPGEKKEMEFIDITGQRSLQRQHKLSALSLTLKRDSAYHQQLLREAARDGIVGVYDYSRSDLFACISMYIGRK